MPESSENINNLYTEQAQKNKGCSFYKKFSDVYHNLNWKPENIEANTALANRLDPNLLNLGIKNEIFKNSLIGTNAKGQIGDFLDDPFLAAIYELKTINNILSGFYVPFSKDEDALKEFLLIYNEFFEMFYFDEGYIAYGEDLKEIEEEHLQEEGNLREQLKLNRNSKFRLYREAGFSSEKDGKIKVVSVLTSRIAWVDKKRLIHVTFNEGIYQIQWLRLLRNYQANKQKFLNLYNTGTKCIFINAPDYKTAEKELEQLDNNNSYYLTRIDENDTNENEVLPTKFISQDEIRKCFQNNEMYFENEAAKYGFPGRGMGNKEERLTAAESFQGMRLAKGAQQTILRKLNNIAKDMKEKFGSSALPFDFKFIIEGEDPFNSFKKPFFNKFSDNFQDEHNFAKGTTEERVPKPPKPGT